MSVKDTIVISFGCPRSGTMFMRNTLQKHLPCFSTKLPEMVALHPAQSDTGLLHLSGLFYQRRLVLVRTVRHPLEVVESFVHLRAAKPRSPRGRDDDRRVRRWIEDESRGVMRQRLELGEMLSERRHRLVEVRYEALKTADGRDEFAEKMRKATGDAGTLRKGLEDFGNAARAYAGRLKSGKGAVLSEERRAWWAHALREVVRREGYA